MKNTATRQHRSPYAHRSCIASTCDACHGAGVVTVTRSRWIGGSRDGYRSEWTGPVRCETCEGYGETYRSELAEVEEPAPSGPGAGALEVGGYTVTAPTFRDAAQFDQAIKRAHDDGLTVEATDRGDCVLVVNPTNGASYTVTRTSCTCTAGRRGTPCKHIAISVFLADVMHQLPRTATAPATAAA